MFKTCQVNWILSEQLRCRAFSASNKAWTPRTKNPPTHPNPTSRYIYMPSDTPLPDIFGHFRTANVTNWHQQLSQHLLRHPKRRLRRWDISSWCWMALAAVWWCLVVFCVVWRRTEGIWRVSECGYGRVYDFGPSDVCNLDVKMIGTFLTLWWNRFQITKYRQTDMLEIPTHVHNYSLTTWVPVINLWNVDNINWISSQVGLSQSSHHISNYFPKGKL